MLNIHCYSSEQEVSNPKTTLSSWYTGSYGNKKVSEDNTLSYTKVAICKTGERNYHDTCSCWLQV